MVRYVAPVEAVRSRRRSGRSVGAGEPAPGPSPLGPEEHIRSNQWADLPPAGLGPLGKRLLGSRVGDHDAYAEVLDGQGDGYEVAVMDLGGVLLECAQLDLQLRVVRLGRKDQHGTRLVSQGTQAGNACDLRGKGTCAECEECKRRSENRGAHAWFDAVTRTEAYCGEFDGADVDAVWVNVVLITQTALGTICTAIPCFVYVLGVAFALVGYWFPTFPSHANCPRTRPLLNTEDELDTKTRLCIWSLPNFVV